MASKRKHTVITLEMKLQVITEVQNDKSQRLVAKTLGVPKSTVTLGVPKSTVGDIWKERKNIEANVSNPSYAKKHCIVRDAHFQKLDNIFSELWTFPSYQHCPVPWCPDM